MRSPLPSSGGAGPRLPTPSEYGVEAITEGRGLARQFTDPFNETYNPASNGSGEVGAYGFLHDYSMPESDSLGGSAYDFPFEEDVSLQGRVSRSYVDWLNGLAEAAGFEADQRLVGATAVYIHYIVFWREREMRRP